MPSPGQSSQLSCSQIHWLISYPHLPLLHLKASDLNYPVHRLPHFLISNAIPGQVTVTILHTKTLLHFLTSNTISRPVTSVILQTKMKHHFLISNTISRPVTFNCPARWGTASSRPVQSSSRSHSLSISFSPSNICNLWKTAAFTAQAETNTLFQYVTSSSVCNLHYCLPITVSDKDKRRQTCKNSKMKTNFWGKKKKKNQHLRSFCNHPQRHETEQLKMVFRYMASSSPGCYSISGRMATINKWLMKYNLSWKLKKLKKQ